MTAQELKTKLDSKEEIQLIDIREEYELELASIGGIHIPLGDVLSNLGKIRKDIPVVFYCKSGNRGGNMMAYLTNLGYSNLHNLDGGITTWAEQVDQSIQVY